MKKNWHKIFLFPFLCLFFSLPMHARRIPRLAVIFVFDQFSYDYIPKLARHMRGGLRFLLHNGIVYENAYMPHGLPTTGPGHTTLSTGAFPKDHGIVANKFRYADGRIVCADDAPAKTSAVLAPHGTYSVGKGPHNIMVDGISDQMALATQPSKKRTAISLSFKSRAAICTAGHAGKAIWFDQASGQFTSSKAYFDAIPNWLACFNKHIGLDRPYVWHKAWPKNKCAYNFKHINNYDYATQPPLVDTIITKTCGKNPYDTLLKTPRANQVLLNLALTCVKAHMTRYGNEQLLLWVCIGSLDKIGHDYGPDSLEAIDLIYHLDKQLHMFMKCLQDCVPSREIVYVFTADHGVTPIPELTAQDGYTPARRINPVDMTERINTVIETKYHIKDLVKGIHAQNVYIDTAALSSLPNKKQKMAIHDLKSLFLAELGIKNVWTVHELLHSCYELPTIESFYKNQIYPGRSGQIIIQPFPYNLITAKERGTCHRTPYERDTHVPIIIYQKGELGKQIIDNKVWAPQIPNTLSYIMQIPKPSASMFKILPGVIDREFRDEWAPV